MNYDNFINDIFNLQSYGLDIFTIGKSLQGRNILGTHVGDYGDTQIIIQCGIHAREWITCYLGVELAKIYSQKEYQEGGIYFIFNTDPDGTALALDGLSSVKCDATKQFLLALNEENEDFSLYKANLNGVDINTNFDAMWGQGEQNVTCPASSSFIGYYPDSERETKTLINFTFKNRPAFTISYHSKGEVIFYGFESQSAEARLRDEKIGEALSESTGYPLIFTSNSTGGYKDYVIEKYGVPSYTIEVGNNDLPHPILLDQLPLIVEQNKNVPQIALDIALELKHNSNI